MKDHALFRKITLKGSKTFYTAVLFFPGPVRRDVFILYAFVRTVDDLVDHVPPKRMEFNRIRDLTFRALAGKPAGEVLVDSFAGLAARRHFPVPWTRDFFRCQESDMDRKSYRDFTELENDFIYGVAGVIGLYMSAVMGLPERHYPAAAVLGKGMQLINTLRDINEDLGFGRTYIPRKDMDRFGLKSIKPENDEQAGLFRTLIRFELERYRSFSLEAERGIREIPRRIRVPVKACLRLYDHIAGRLGKDPMVVFRKKVRPSKLRIIATLLWTVIAG